MSKTVALVAILVFAGSICNNLVAQDGWGSFALGFRAGISKLEGDLNYVKVNPSFSVHTRYFPIPYVGLGVGAGYSNLGSRNAPERAALQWNNTSVIPVDGTIVFRLFPLHRVSPYAEIGGSAVYWKATDEASNTLRKGWDAFVNVGGGLEVPLSNTLRLNLGANFHYCFVDELDMRNSGDEDDGFLDGHIGISFYFPVRSRFDFDGDGVPNDIDLDIRRAEDKDGYLDHDGVPEENPDLSRFREGGKNLLDEVKDIAAETSTRPVPPVVIHHPIRRVEEDQGFGIKADVYEDDSLRVCAALYRLRSELKWSVLPLAQRPGLLYRYQGTIPDSSVRPEGLEYFIAAVDEPLSGVGFSGLPGRPLRVQVFENAKGWRTLGGTVAALAWSAASFLVLRRQK